MRTLTIVLVLAAAAFWMGSAYGQTIRVADNNANAPTGDNVFPTLQKAINAAEEGDIVQVTPSETSYGAVTIRKRLTVYGVGFHPDKDVPTRSTVGRITLGIDRAAPTEASGTIISGLSLSGVTFSGGEYGKRVRLREIVIERCRVAANIGVRDYETSVDGLLIRNCIFVEGYHISLSGEEHKRYERPAHAGIVIVNNVFSKGSYHSCISASSHAVISNNVFIASVNSDYEAFDTVTDCEVANNIFYGRMPTASSKNERNTFNNNLTFGTNADDLPPKGTGVGNSGEPNLVGKNPLFKNFPPEGSNTWSYSWDFRLKDVPEDEERSPGIDWGTDGTDIGIFGGGSPFDPSGAPLPLIQQFIVSPLVREGGTLNVTVKAKSK